jgi:hypothetical protein
LFGDLIQSFIPGDSDKLTFTPLTSPLHGIPQAVRGIDPVMVEQPPGTGAKCREPHVTSLYLNNSAVLNIEAKGTRPATVMTAYRRNDFHLTKPPS